MIHTKQSYGRYIIPRFSALAFAATTGALSLAAHGAVLFSDDFESYTADTNINTTIWSQVDGVITYMAVRDENTATPFGATNQYGRLADVGGGSNQFLRLLSTTESDAYNALTTLSFDFYEPTGGGDSNLIFGYAGNDGTRYDLNSAGRRASATFNNGTIGGVTGGTTTYSLDTAYTIYMILNDTASAASYDGGTLAAYTAHVWFEELGSGSFVYAGSTTAANSPNASGYRVGFRTFNADLQEVWVDNVSVFTGAAAVPEPRAALLGGLGLLALLRRRR